MNTLHIYGTSDDLVELEGAIEEEFSAYDGGALSLHHDGHTFTVACIFTQEGFWVFAPNIWDERYDKQPFLPKMSISFGKRKPGFFPADTTSAELNAPEYSQILTLEIPEGTTATFETRES